MRPHPPHPKRYSPYGAYTKQPNLSRPTKAAGRFATPLSMAEVDRACNKFIPKNTRKVNKWATTVFIDWLTQRNETVSDSEVLPNIVESEQPQETLDLVLATFLLESRRKDGNCYPANTLRNILGSLARYTG